MMMTETAPRRRKKAQEKYLIHPAKFLLWIFLVSVGMLFAAFTSALLVQRTSSKGYEDLDFNATMFYISSGVIVLSSLTLHWAYRAGKRNEVEQNRTALWLTLGLGVVFLILQVFGFLALADYGYYFVSTNLASSWYYVIPAVHGLHIIGGLGALIGALIHAYKFKIHSKSMVRMDVVATYWHFMGGLWIYLFAILNYYA